MVSNALEAIKAAVEVHAAANRLVMTPQQRADIESAHVPALIANWVSHYETASSASLDSRVLLGVLKTCDSLAECFQYDCSCRQPGTITKVYYKNLVAKQCRC
jgi:hypothetical protein